MAIYDEPIAAREERVRRAVSVSPLTAWAIRILAIFVFACGLAYFVGSVVPWRPLDVHGFKAVPSQACEGELISIRTERTLRQGLPPDVRDLNIEIRSYWQNVDTHNRTAEDVANISEAADGYGPYGRHTITSPLLREAPTEPGVWRLVATYEVSGTPLYVRRTYHVKVKSGPILTTSGCKEG